MEYFYKILLPISGTCIFTYKCDELLNIGAIVNVVFRKKNIIGVIVEIQNLEDVESYYEKIKSIEKIYDFNLDTRLLDLISKVASYYLESQGLILSMALPVLGKTFLEKITQYNPEKYKFLRPDLNAEQLVIYNDIMKFLSNGGYSAHLIDGVTGSGKTEVYFAIAMELVETTDKQILLLLPEISLANQITERFEKRFGVKPTIWHSSLSIKEKKQGFYGIINGSTRIIIGTRSALFLPYKNLGLIIVDEEHDQSYKQEDMVLYNARDMAVLRANIEKTSVILGSATPSIETIVNTRQGKYHLHKLTARFSDAKLPEIRVIHMKSSSKGFISAELKELMHQTLKNDKQIMLFINRRGYAPIATCSKCSLRYACPDCSTWLVKHNKYNNLQCHHCGYHTEIPNICISCGQEDSIIYIGPGIERIYKEVLKEFPDENITLISKDDISDNNDFINKLANFANGSSNIMIGTQMITKGLHFSRLSLVGVIDADMSLRSTDFRAAEKTYQLLEQVGGRAGREGSGIVILQSYEPDSRVINMIKNRQKEEFIDYIIADREKNNMPPFHRMASIVLSDVDENKVQKFANELYLAIPKISGIVVLGPAQAEIYRIRSRYRYRFMIKSPKNFNVQYYINNFISTVKKPASIRIKIDIDPYSFI